ncbi:acyltransferase family protein [Symbioplanes lichenis]|uniref:acyltransferase family protein n=1 Tax=Symbioplanes lichenis TaxID=1629072 RepID=UPI00273820B4|nr:acyltransferase family protein [Actinoplanes lichenis]
MTDTMTTSAPAQRRHRPGGGGKHTAAPARHRRDIEGLRAVAVLLVVAYHCGLPIVSGGYVGVDVFFVISGFLITGLLLREATSSGTISLPRFYARRALRLLPASALVVVATVAAAALWLPPLRLTGILSDALHTSIYAMNYRLAAIGTDYLQAEADPSPLQHFWSLAVEEQFYVIWPLLILLLKKHRGVALSLLTAGSFAISVWQTQASAGWAYFGIHTRAWELGVGALLALGAVKLPRWCVPLGLAAIVTAAVCYTAQTPFPGYAALLPVLGTAAVIAGGTGRPAGVLGLAPFQAVGRLSYSWYLWHWPVLLIAPFALGRPLALGENVLAALGALILAALTFALVENPVRHMARNRPWRGLAAGFGISVLCATLCVGITTAAGRLNGPSTYAAPAVTTTNLRTLLGATDRAVPENLTPTLAKAAKDKPRFYREGCSGGFDDAEVKKPCAYGDLASPTTVVLMGDSHAGHWFPALEEAALREHWKLVVVSKSACTVADSLIFLPELKREFTECVRWRRDALDYVRSLRPAKVVLASTYPNSELLGVSGTQEEAWVAGWRKSVRAVKADGTRVYFVNDTPWMAGNTPECLSAHPDDPAACGRARDQAIAKQQRRDLVMATVRAEGATVVDPSPWFCTDTFCPAVVGNLLVYKDQHHVTTAYSKLLAPLLAEELR